MMERKGGHMHEGGHSDGGSGVSTGLAIGSMAIEGLRRAREAKEKAAKTKKSHTATKAGTQEKSAKTKAGKTATAKRRKGGKQNENAGGGQAGGEKKEAKANGDKETKDNKETKESKQKQGAEQDKGKAPPDKEQGKGTEPPPPTEPTRQFTADLFTKDASKCNCGAFVTNIVGNAELGITDHKHLSEFEKAYKKAPDQTKPKVGDVVVYGYSPDGQTWFEHMALVVQANGETKVIGISKKGGKILLSSVKGQWDPGSSATYFTPNAGVADTTAEQTAVKEKEAAYQSEKTDANKAAADKAWANLVNKALTPK